MKEQIDKQAIEEMAKVIEKTEQIARDAHCGLPSPTMYAKDLYWHGYRKQSEGEWKSNGSLKHCSECGNVVNFRNVSRWLYNFCPNCGAKMKGGSR